MQRAGPCLISASLRRCGRSDTPAGSRPPSWKSSSIPGRSEPPPPYPVSDCLGVFCEEMFRLGCEEMIYARDGLPFACALEHGQSKTAVAGTFPLPTTLPSSLVSVRVRESGTPIRPVGALWATAPETAQTLRMSHCRHTMRASRAAQRSGCSPFPGDANRRHECKPSAAQSRNPGASTCA